MPVSVKSFRENVPQKDSSPSQQAIYTSLGIGPARRLTNGYPILDLNRRRHFIITLNLSDRRHSNSDYAAPAQLYRGNLPHYHWLGRRIPSVAAIALGCWGATEP